jgi:hypothetical protein
VTGRGAYLTGLRLPGRSLAPRKELAPTQATYRHVTGMLDLRKGGGGYIKPVKNIGGGGADG